MILHARRPAYRPRALTRLHDRERGVFEHWTHDASLIPMRLFPHWRLKFRRYEEQLAARWRAWGRRGFEDKLDVVLRRIADQGPCSSSDVGEGEERPKGGWWDWHPSKAALEYLWRTGRLAVARRDASFRKVYDLTERVIPPEHLGPRPIPEETVDWACGAALDRLGFATSGELAAFWDLVTPAEAKAWCEGALGARRDRAGRDRARLRAVAAVLRPPRHARRGAARARGQAARPEPLRPRAAGPQASGAALRLLLPHRGLRARGEAAVRLLRLPHPRGRAPRRPDRHEGRPGARRAARRRAVARGPLAVRPGADGAARGGPAPDRPARRGVGRDVGRHGAPDRGRPRRGRAGGRRRAPDPAGGSAHGEATPARRTTA